MPTARFGIAAGSKWTLRWGLAFAATILAVPLGIVIFGLPHGPVVFSVSTRGLTIEGDPYGRSVPWSALKLSEARPFNPANEGAQTLTIRTNGIGMPGYRSGWFETRGLGEALVFLADESRGLLIPTTLGYTLILGPDDPEGLIDTLKHPSDEPKRYVLAVPGAALDGMPPGMLGLLLALIGAPTAIAVLTVIVCVRTRRVVFEVSDASLRIRGDLYGRTIPRGILRLDEARRVDLTTGPDRLTLIRVNGVGAPGYRSGWLRSIPGGASYLAFLTERTRVVLIPTTAGYTLLLSPAAPDLFLQALTAPVGGGRP